MAVSVETRSAPVSITRFQTPQPSRTIGLVWRNSTPLAKQYLLVSEVIRKSVEPVRNPVLGR